jgi:hypothetical protein
MNRQFYYRWLLVLTNHPDSLKRIEHTQGHSNEDTVEARLNDKVDFYASASQKFFKELLQALITFYMNDFTFYNKSDKWIDRENNFSSYIDARLVQSCTIL